MSAKDNIRIALYEPWMLEQIIKMICQEYGFNENNEYRLIKNFYELPYQQEKSIRITALDGKKVVGFQTFFQWSYLLDGKPFNTYQSGNSIVDPHYQKRGIFARLLNYLDEIREEKQIDFLVGFPINRSYNSLIRNKWTNVLNLHWYVKVLNPFSIIQKLKLPQLSLETACEDVPNIPPRRGFTLNRDSEFETWRHTYSVDNNYFYFHHDDGDFRCRFDLKVNRRGALKELIVGRVRTNCDNLEFLKKAVKALVKKVRVQRAFTFISVALNRQYYKPGILHVFKQSGFIHINQEIFFLVKDFKVGEMVYKPELWELYRSDIDTW